MPKSSRGSPKRGVHRVFLLLTALLLVLILSSAPSVAANEGGEEGVVEPEQQQEQHQEQHQQEPEQQSAPPEEETHVPVQEEEAPPEPIVPEEPVQEETEPEEQKVEPVNNDHLFELHVFECMAPKGDPAPLREGPVAAGTIMTLCVRPKNEEAPGIKLQAFTMMQYNVADLTTLHVVKNNESLEPMTRVVCPFREEDRMCIVATKLQDELFVKSAAASALGSIQMTANGEERTVPFMYRFQVEKSEQPPPVEHEYFDMPASPPPFPCGKEIRVWIISALMLTLLEFAFSPSSDAEASSSEEDAADKKSKNSGGGEKTKKNKKE